MGAVTITTINQVIEAIEDAAPGSIAVVDGPAAMTYRRLDHESSRLAARLRDLGVCSNVVVGVWGDRSADFALAALAVWKAGGAYLPIDCALPSERIAYMLRSAGARALVGRGLAGARERAIVDVVDLDHPLSVADPSVERCARRNSDLAYVIFTSGSTGKPKGVAVADASLANLIAWHISTFGVTPRDRSTLLANVGFDASVWELWPCLAAGASLVVPPDFVRGNALALRDWLVDTCVTTCFVPTPIAEQLLRLDWPAAPLRTLLTGGDVLHVRPPRRLPFTVVNNYGPTEATVVATSVLVEPEDAGVPAIGRPIANAAVYLFDGMGRLVPDGEIGEMWIGGAGVAVGYVNNPDLTAERFVPDPFVKGGRLYRTGDLARRQPDGQLIFEGRADEQIKVRGCRVEPAEVIAALDRHPGVAASALRLWGAGADARLIAYVVARNRAVDDTGLRAHLRTTLPDYMVPSAFVSMSTLPLTARGKIDRTALPPVADDNVIRDAAPAGPAASAFDNEVAAIIAEVLEVSAVDPDDNFFLLGGHSLMAAQVLACIRDRIGVSLTMRMVFDFPTARGLASEVGRLAAGSDAAVVREVA